MIKGKLRIGARNGRWCVVSNNLSPCDLGRGISPMVYAVMVSVIKSRIDYYLAQLNRHEFLKKQEIEIKRLTGQFELNCLNKQKKSLH